MKLLSIRIYICIICFPLFQSCITDFTKIGIEDLPKNNEPFESTIIVQGIISSELEFQTVTLSKSVNLGQNNDSVSGAIVEVSIGNKTYEYIESIYHSDYLNKQKGLYVSIEKIQGKVGTIHTLHVTYNNQEYFAKDSMIKVNEFEFKGMNLPSLKKIMISSSGNETTDTTLNFGGIYFCQPESYTLKWSWVSIKNINEQNEIIYERVWHNGYYFTKIENPEINNISKYSLNAIPLIEIEDSLVITKKYSISQAYQTFLVESFKEIYWNRSRFSSIPSNISTNVTNGGKGFFAACDVIQKQIVYKDLFERAKKNR